MPVTDAPPTTDTTTATTDGELLCDVCPHVWAAHDPLGSRFCSATIASRSTRGCICVGDALRTG
jgi:hypothetical protein